MLSSLKMMSLVLARSRGAVSFTEVGDAGRGAMWRQSMISFVLAMMSLKDERAIRAERPRRPAGVQTTGADADLLEDCLPLYGLPEPLSCSCPFTRAGVDSTAGLV